MVGGQGERLVVSAPIIIERDIVDYVNVIVKLVDLKREETTDWRGKKENKRDDRSVERRRTRSSTTWKMPPMGNSRRW